VALGGLTQEKLARAMDVTLRTVARYEDPTEGPGVEGPVNLYTFAKAYGFAELAAEFRAAAMRTVSEQHEAERQKLAKKIDQTDSPENLAFLRKQLGRIWDECSVADDVDAKRKDFQAAMENIRSITESIADRHFVNGSDAIITGTDPQ
jgi:hypothetical protein